MLRDEILSAGKLPSESVTVPGVETPVIVRGLSAAGRASLFATCFDDQGKAIDGKFYAAELIVRCCEDEAGDKVFSLRDADLVASMKSSIVDPLFAAAQRLSSLKDAEKNS